MNIALSGYGKMGREVEKAAGLRNHTIVIKLDQPSDWKLLPTLNNKIDVVIDFSMPEVAVENIFQCFQLGLPVVTGTTGWYNHLDEVEKQCTMHNGTLFYAPNFSIGVNLFFTANKQLSRLMSDVEGYNVHIEETHHIHKLDAPSGTAIKVAEGILENNLQLKKWVNNKAETDDELPVISYRKGEEPGTHQVIYESGADRITLKHEAKNRSGFAMGALMAAEFVIGKKGVFTMTDLLGI